MHVDRRQHPGHTHGRERLSTGQPRRTAKQQVPSVRGRGLAPCRLSLWRELSCSQGRRPSPAPAGADRGYGLCHLPLSGPCLHLPLATLAFRSGVRIGGHEAAPLLCAPFPAEKQPWPRLQRLLGQEESGRSEWLSARSPLKHPALRGPGSSISPQPWLPYKIGHWRNPGQIGLWKIS